MRVAVVTLTGVFLAASAFAQNPCTASGGVGVRDKNGPTVCIDPKTGTADPEDVEVYEGSTVNFWFTDSTNRLDIRFKYGTKVKNKKRSGPHVWVEADDVSVKQQKKYKIRNLTTGKSWDPTIIIEPLQEPQPAPAPIKPRPRFAKE